MEQTNVRLDVALEVETTKVGAHLEVQVCHDPTAASPPSPSTATIHACSSADSRLRSLYARFKASSLRFDFSDDQNMATLAALPIVQTYLSFSASTSSSSTSTLTSTSSGSSSGASGVVFGEDDLFCLIFRLNRPFPLMTADEEVRSAIRRRMTAPELVEVSTGLVLRCVLRMRYRAVREQMAHLCGGGHNAPDLSFFLDHGHVFVVIPRHHHHQQKQQGTSLAHPDGNLHSSMLGLTI